MPEFDYRINDAYNPFNEPLDCFERHIDPKQADLAIRSVIAPDGAELQLFAGEPSKFHNTSTRQVTFSAEELDARPSEIFRQHFVVAPYPEANVEPVVAEIGMEPIVFGSDFPHSEGLAHPAKYAEAQLASFSDDDVCWIMRDNLEQFLVGAP